MHRVCSYPILSFFGGNGRLHGKVGLKLESWKKVDDASMMGSVPSVVPKRKERWGVLFGGLLEFVLLDSVCVIVACVCSLWRIK